MTDFKKLEDAIERSGKSMTRIAKDSGILRETLYNRKKGIGEFKASEITGMQRALRLTDQERDEIFLQ